MSDAVRIAVVSTPRSGNTWIRYLLAAAYRVPDLAVHQLRDDDWETLPRECVVQIHWNRSREFTARLSQHGFRVVTVSRHPLDTLISIVPFALMDGDTHSWLLGRGGDESGLFATTPRSRAFVRYATGPRAAALFSVTRDWWGQPGVACVRYEDIVADPIGELSKLCNQIAPPRETDLAAVVAGHTFERVRPRAGNGHFWQGRPGHWRELLTLPEATEIASAIPDAFAPYGYAFDPDPTLTADAADANWVRAAGPALRAAMQRSLDAQARAEQHRIAAEDARHARRVAEEQSAAANGFLEHAVAEKSAAIAEAARACAGEAQAIAEAERRGEQVVRLSRRVAELEARFSPFVGLKGFEVRVARWIANIRGRLPKVAGRVR